MCILMKCRTAQRAKLQLIEELILKEMRSIEAHQCKCICIMLYLSLTIYTSIYMLTQICTHTLTDRSGDVVGWDGAREGRLGLGRLGRCTSRSGVHEREGWA